MSRNRTAELEEQDHDSFLDIVANMVGILIILVMVVSVRAKDAPAPSSPAGKSSADLTARRATVQGLHGDTVRLANEARVLDATLAARDRERQAMATLVAAATSALEDHRRQLTGRQQRAFDVQQELADGRTRLEQLELERVQAVSVAPTVVEVESLPTPLSKTVFGKEVHFHLRSGHLVFVPLDELFEEAKAQARQKIWRLDGLPEVTELVGPQGGFRMRYTLEKVEIPVAMRLETGRTGHMIRSKRWELIPTDAQLGEPLKRALTPGSTFRLIVGKLDPKNTTVTVWVYPDSFDDFRRLKKELFQLGFAAAARPLPPGVPIAGSPNGSRSSAQ